MLTTDSLSEMFFNDFGAFFEKEIPRVIKPSRPKKRSLDLPQILENNIDCNFRNSAN